MLKCLEVGSAAAYNRLVKDLEDLTTRTQKDEHVERVKEVFIFERTFVTNRYCMLVIKISDDRGNDLYDYDVVFTAGPDFDPNHLPPWFFVDRQRNLLNPGKLTYFIDYDVMNEDTNLSCQKVMACASARGRARDSAYYTVAEHRGTFNALKRYFRANWTLMFEVELQRHVVEGVFG